MPYMTPITRITALAAAALVTGGLTGCGVAAGDERTTLHVLAASSLTEAFEELSTAYGTVRPNVTLRFDFAGSLELASDVADREPADVLATSDRRAMDPVADRLTGRRVFAHNAMTIAVAPGDPRHIRGLADLANPRLRVVLGGPDVPVGRYAARVLSRAGVSVRPDSEEADSRSALTRVRTGTADAALVYLTDMRSAGISASSVPIPARQNVKVSYNTAVVRGGHEDAARAFVAWLGSAQATAILRKYGFPAP